MTEKSFAIFFTASLGLLLIPVPTWMIDVCVVLNLAFSIILFMGVFKVSNPLKLYTLPTLILLLTIFRLCLNIATSRSILGSGEAGSIVESFGELANAGDIAVGIVIFTLITIVQIVVITKGAERVAEVSARFALDALPGKQMSIDADLRAGLIDLEGARAKREELQVESRFHGALDGAMKFVKGDAVAGAVITLVNLLGGGAIGAIRDGLPIAEVISKYSVLTIGDGLVAQLSSFSCAVAAGVMVTRVAKEGSPGLSADLFGQLAEIRVAGLTMGILLLILSFVPGVPHIILFLCGSTIFMIFYKARRRMERQFKGAEVQKTPFKLNPLLAIRLGGTGQVEQRLLQDILSIRQRLWIDLGIPIPPIEIERAEMADVFELVLRGEVIWRSSPVESVYDSEDLYQQILGIRAELVDDPMTQRLCDIFESECSSLISMVIPQALSITGLTHLLRGLVEEEISLRSFDVILQVVAERFNRGETDSRILSEVRIRLRRSIQEQIKKRVGRTPDRLIIDPLLDMKIADDHKAGKLPDNKIIEEIEGFVSQYLTRPAILSVSKYSRELVRDILKFKGVRLDVFAHEELIGVEFGKTEFLRPAWVDELVQTN